MAVVPYGPRKVLTAALPAARRTAAQTATSAGVGLEGAKADAALTKGRAEGQVGAALAQFGGTMVQTSVALSEQAIKWREAETERANEVAVLHQQRQLAEWETKTLYDPETGALTKRGREAMGVPEVVAADFRDLVGALNAELTNDDQRLAFAKIASTRALNLDMTLRRHVYTEMQRYEGEELQATVVNAQNAAIANASDPRRVGLELSTAVSAIKLHGPHLGLGPEQVEQQVAAAQTVVHTGVIESLIAQEKVRAAEVYFEETKDQITGPAIARIEKALQEGTLRKSVQDQTDKILAGEPTDLAAQRKTAKEIDDPQVRAGVLQQLEHEANVRALLDREAHEALVTAGKNTIDRTSDWRSIPAGEWAQFTVGEAAALKSYAEHKVTQTPIKTDPNAYYLLSQMAASSDPEVRQKFYQTNLVGFLDRLSPSDLQQFMDAQAKGRAGDEDKLRALMVNTTNQNRMVDEAILGMGMDPTPPQPGAKAFDQAAANRVTEFRRQVRESVQILEARQGKAATDDQVQEIVDTLRLSIGKELTRWTILPFGWGDVWTERHRFEVTKVSQIPTQDRRQIEDALRKKNLPVTDATILQLYKLGPALTSQVR